MTQNTKENRVAFLRNCFNALRPQSEEELKSIGKDLNSVFCKKRQVVVISSFKRWSELRSELWSELWSELRSELRSELWSELGSVWEFYESAWSIFVAEFYPQSKVIQRNENKIEVLRKLVFSGNAYLQTSKEKLILIPFPKIKLREKRLHSEISPACVWFDKESYWLNGVRFEKKLWEDIVKKTISVEKALKLNNIEQRIVALQYIGGDRLMSEMGGVVESEDEFGRLVSMEKLKDNNGKSWKYFVAIDPSKGKEVWLRTRPDIKTPREAETYSYRLNRWKIRYDPVLRT